MLSEVQKKSIDYSAQGEGGEDHDLALGNNYPKYYNIRENPSNLQILMIPFRATRYRWDIESKNHDTHGHYLEIARRRKTGN